MSRLPRLGLPNIPQHIIQRGNNRQACFQQNKDYSVYLAKLKEYADDCCIDIHSYVLMTNHVHLLVTPQTADGVSKLMQSLGRYYVQYFNKSHDRTGTLWEGRFKSFIVDSESYFLTVSRYIELNPVRAGLVECPSDYKWSSYGGNALGLQQEILTKHICYLNLGSTTEERLLAYGSLFKVAMKAGTLDKIRSSINKSSILGREEFIKQIEMSTDRRVRLHQRGGDRKSKLFKSANQVF